MHHFANYIWPVPEQVVDNQQTVDEKVFTRYSSLVPHLDSTGLKLVDRYSNETKYTFRAAPTDTTVKDVVYRNTADIQYIVREVNSETHRVVKLLETHPARCGYVPVRMCTMTDQSSGVLLPVMTGPLVGVRFTENEIDYIITMVRDQVQCISRLYVNRQLAYQSIAAKDVMYRRRTGVGD